MSDWTLEVYDARAADYGAMTEKLYELREAEGLAAALPPGGRILDLGCGPGFYAAWFAARGFEVDAVDGSAEMVAMANTQPGVVARRALFDENDGDGVYDGVWANFSLLHAPRTAFPGHLERLHRALVPGGVLHLGMKLGTGEGPDRIGRFYAYYSEDELERLLNAAGFTVTARHRGKGPGLDGTVTPYVTMLAHG
jgi:SAM-dependent methyltransferase